jgi:hypothetical protein
MELPLVNSNKLFSLYLSSRSTAIASEKLISSTVDCKKMSKKMMEIIREVHVNAKSEPTVYFVPADADNEIICFVVIDNSLSSVKFVIKGITLPELIEEIKAIDADENCRTQDCI